MQDSKPTRKAHKEIKSRTTESITASKEKIKRRSTDTFRITYQALSYMDLSPASILIGKNSKPRNIWNIKKSR